MEPANRKSRAKTYIGILDGRGKVLGVRIPDIDGGGATPEAAIADVTRALRDVMAHKQSNGVTFPKASPIADILKRENCVKVKVRSSFPWSSMQAAPSAPT